MALSTYLKENSLPDEEAYSVDEVGNIFSFHDVFKSPTIEVGAADIF
jgi:hypothetical protein